MSQTIATFFSQVMAAIGGNSVGPGKCYHNLSLTMFSMHVNALHGFYLRVVCFPVSELAGDAVVNVYINHEKKFAFVEMRTVEEASNAMALDGIIFEACQFQIIIKFLFLFSLKSMYNCHKG